MGLDWEQICQICPSSALCISVSGCGPSPLRDPPAWESGVAQQAASALTRLLATRMLPAIDKSKK
uniref:Uncharacterized protein n=1 Tax=Arundo donax TaxID=35708 RepID=A0A0A9HCU3_ARUDO